MDLETTWIIHNRVAAPLCFPPDGFINMVDEGTAGDELFFILFFPPAGNVFDQ